MGGGPPASLVPRGRALRRDRHGRVPYAFAALVVGLALLLLVSSLLSSEVLWTGGITGHDTEIVDQAMTSAVAMLEENASEALLGELAHLLEGGANPPLQLLNSSVASDVQQYVATAFHGSTTHSPLCPSGRDMGPATVCVLSFWVGVTFPSWQGNGLAPNVAPTPPDAGSAWPAMPGQEVSTTGFSVPAQVNETPFPAVVGAFVLSAVDPSGTSTVASYPFLRTETVPLGLLESSSDLFTADLTGPDGGFARLAAYILSTVAELRALLGYGSGGYSGPDTGATTGVAEVLTPADVANAGALAVMVETLYTFHATDPSAVTLFGNSLPPRFSSLLHAALQGRIDGAALFLYLESTPGSLWSNENVAVGETLAQAISSFSDRFTFDLLHTIWGAQTVDPTLREPVADWAFVWSLTSQWAQARLSQYMTQYRSWMGSQLSHLTSYTGTSPVGIMGAWADQDGPGDLLCYYPSTGGPIWVGIPDFYTIFPGGSYSATTGAVGNTTSLVLGNPNAAAPYNPAPYVVKTTLKINAQGGPSTIKHTFDYTLVDSSLLGEYTTSTPTNGASNDTLTQLLTDLSWSMSTPAGSSLSSPGYVPYVAGWMDGQVPSGLSTSSVGVPDPTSPLQLGPSGAGSTYLQDGVGSLYSGPFASALSTLAADEPTQSSSWFVQGAEYPRGLGSGPNQGDANSLLDIARLAVRLWTMMDYNLYWGGIGQITPIYTFGPVSYQQQAPYDERISSPPAPYSFPDLPQDLQVSAFDDIYKWISTHTASPSCSYDSACQAGYYGAICVSPWGPGSGYFNALALYFWNPQGVWDALAPSTLTVAAGSVGRVASQAQPALVSAWADTGNAHWNSAYFRSWVEQSLGGSEVLPDMASLASTWAPELYGNAQSWNSRVLDEHTLVDQPTLLGGLPFQAWQGNRSQAVAGGGLLDEGPPQVSLALRGTTLGLSPPLETLQFVDPQDRSSDMGISPFQTTWDVRYSSTVDLVLTVPGDPVLPGPSGPEPTRLALSVPLHAEFPVTVVTPWPLETGAQGVPSDPTLTYTRGLTGIEGADVHVARNPDFLPGTYVSPTLIDLLGRVGIVGGEVLGETTADASLLSALPDTAASGGPGAAEGLGDGLDYATNAMVATDQQGNSASVRGDMGTMNSLLSRIGFPSLLYLNNYAFLGDNLSLTLQGTYVATFGEGTNAASVLDASLTFSASALSFISVDYDNAYAPYTFSLVHTPNGATGLGLQLRAGWLRWGVTSSLALTAPGGGPAGPSGGGPTALGALYVPALGTTVPSADLYEQGSPSLPSPAAGAYSRSVGEWLSSYGPTAPPTFDEVVSAEQFAFGYYYDSVRQSGLSGTLDRIDLGVSLGLGNTWSSGSIAYAPGGAVTAAGLETFLEWAVSANRPLAYALGEPTPDEQVIAQLPPSLLASVFWNDSLGGCGGGLGSCPAVGDVYANYPGAFSSPNLAAIESDLGGLGGGLSNHPEVILGGNGPSGSSPFLGQLTY
ncbi:MAG: hypothetical protein KGI98_09545 [Euryarchaeota archaeon]|nr:hypothetical protein [Euryarchaeota archaeon]MDE1881487.1 hypothetical protein [Euryarchaeota archaeon]